MPFGAELDAAKPGWGKLFSAIGHVLAAKHPKPKHLMWRKLWLELRVKALAYRRCAKVHIAPLHSVADDNALLSHRISLRESTNSHIGRIEPLWPFHSTFPEFFL